MARSRSSVTWSLSISSICPIQTIHPFDIRISLILLQIIFMCAVRCCFNTYNKPQIFTWKPHLYCDEYKQLEKRWEVSGYDKCTFINLTCLTVELSRGAKFLNKRKAVICNLCAYNSINRKRSVYLCIYYSSLLLIFSILIIAHSFIISYDFGLGRFVIIFDRICAVACHVSDENKSELETGVRHNYIIWSAQQL